MLEVLFNTIPKSTGEAIFSLSILFGVFLVFQRKPWKKETLILLLIIGFMITWRVLIRITSSRYASLLIIPFCLSTTLFLFSNNIRFPIRFFLGVIFLLIVACSFCKIFLTVNSGKYIYNITETVCRNQNKEINPLFYLDSKDLERIIFYSKSKDFNVSSIEENNVSNAIKENAIVPNTSLYLYRVTHKKDIKNNYSSDLIPTKTIAHVRNRKKTLSIIKVPSRIKLKRISRSEIPTHSNNLLKNADFEEVDTKDISFNKLQKNVPNYSQHYDLINTSITPRYCYFHTISALDSNIFFNTTDDNPISGNYSVRIKNEVGYVYLVMNQHFHSGKYTFSMCFTGRKDSTLEVQRLNYRKTKSFNTPIVRYILQDKSLFNLETDFTVDDLSADEHFAIGILVYNGDITIDNICLIHKE